MPSIVICEKASQANNVREAVGSRYGEVLAASGHLLRLATPEEINPDWKVWSFDLLRPESGFYPMREDREGMGGRSGKTLDRIKAALATADKVIIATDCDREGQAIGENLLRFYKFKGEVLRAMFSNEDKDTLQKAFAAAKPNTEYLPLYNSAIARVQADQIANFTATRTVTIALKPAHMKGVLRTSGLVSSLDFA